MKTKETPCGECPFLKTSAPGWLGGFSVQQMHLAATSEAPFNCHLTRGTSDVHECTGRMMYAAKACKMFADPAMEAERQRLKSESDLTTILSVPEFHKHHGGG